MEWNREPRTWAAIAAALLLWASAFAGIKAGLASYGPGELALFRFGTASAVLAVYAVVTRMRLPDRRDLPLIGLAGLLGISVYHVALNIGEMRVSAGAAALLIATGPVFTAVFSAALLSERLSARAWVGIAIAFVGVALISFGEGGGIRFEPASLAVLVAAMSIALYFIVAKRPLRRYSALEFTTYAIWAGTVPLLVFAAGLVRQLGDATVSATLSALYLGVLPGAASYVMWSYALARMPASILAAFLYLQPVNAMIIAWIWLGELPVPLTVAGGVLSIAGVVLVNLGAGNDTPARAGVPPESGPP